MGFDMSFLNSPLSRRLRNIFDEPFFNGGVDSLIAFISSMVRVRRFNRAAKIRNQFSIYYMGAT